MNKLDYVVDKVLNIVRKDIRKSTNGSYNTGKVKRIDGNIAWVQYDENNPQLTPVIISGASCKKGDEVRIQNNNGTAFILGNDSNPPTDDTKAEHAQTTADVADKTAKDAQLVASEAIEDAEHTAQYFWYRDGNDSEAGAHVTKVPQEDFEANPQGGNLLMRTEGIAVRDGTTKLATFEDSGITIGKEADTHTEFTTDGLKFYLDENTNPVNLDIKQDTNGYRWGKLIANYNNIRQASVTTDADSHTAYVHSGVYTDDPNGTEWATEVQTNARGIRQIVQAMGGQATNATVTLQPKSSDPTSADYYNMEYVIGVPVRGTLETPTVSISATTGTLVSATARRFGQVVQLYMQVRKTSSTAAGANVFVGTLNTTALIPVIPARGASYFGTHSIVGALSAAGEIIIRNASSTAVTIGAGETAGITFTYLVA